VRTRRLQGLGAGVGAALLALFALGCPEGADLENPQSYPKPGYMTASGGSGTAGATAGGAAAGGNAASCETACIKDIFQVQPVLCALCHNKNMAGPLTSAGLDLKTDGFTARLLNIPATHTDIVAPMTNANCPKGDKLIDSSNPSASWLLKKIEGTQGDCGTPMPQTGQLSMAQKTCLETYIACVAGGPITGGGGAAAGGSGGTAAGGGGAASGGGGSGGAATGGGGTAAGGGGSGGTGGT
jgi:hypothetical protein